ncbi:MAG TPA: chemotaxis protein CheW [Polyangiales bacterium]|jgi:purine-binding chemotaxis protein CheW|nr:chemotaxis protein CheW [Polyangiales bacterium]
MVEPRKAATTLVAFEVGGALYAIDIQRVREIIRPLPMEVLPHAPAMLVGVVDHRGDVVPLVDLRVRFATPTTSSEAGSERGTRWIIVERAGRLVGLVVDRVQEVFSAQDAQERQVPDLGPGAEQRGILAAYSHRNRLVFVADVDRLTDVAAQASGLLRNSARPEAR